MSPVISVIVANYNGERFLAEALRSILAQSFSALEILLVDDHSTDSSLGRHCRQR
jgi:glycosyltransferase involved in cell wall biosynthesis